MGPMPKPGRKINRSVVRPPKALAKKRFWKREGTWPGLFSGSTRTPCARKEKTKKQKEGKPESDRGRTTGKALQGQPGDTRGAVGLKGGVGKRETEEKNRLGGVRTKRDAPSPIKGGNGKNPVRMTARAFHGRLKHVPRKIGPRRVQKRKTSQASLKGKR